MRCVLIDLKTVEDGKRTSGHDERIRWSLRLRDHPHRGQSSLALLGQSRWKVNRTDCRNDRRVTMLARNGIQDQIWGRGTASCLAHIQNSNVHIVVEQKVGMEGANVTKSKEAVRYEEGRVARNQKVNFRLHSRFKLWGPWHPWICANPWEEPYVPCVHTLNNCALGNDPSCSWL